MATGSCIRNVCGMPMQLGRLSGHVVRHSVRRITGAAQAVLDTRKSAPVKDSHMSYLDTAVGDNTVVFLHGNPTSAYLWRNIIPHVQGAARCVAPDLIGMGHSGKPSIQYKFTEHYDYLSTWWQQMDFPGKVSIVCHDWGSGLGLHWAHQNQDKVASIVHMESIVASIPSWDNWPDVSRSAFQALRSAAGEEMILEKNIFVERLLPGSILRKLSEEEMTEYRRPFLEKCARRPLLTWPREIPVASDGPQDVVDIVDAYSAWLTKDDTIPKLYIDGDPGFLSAGIRSVVATLARHRSVTVKGLHFLQEDSPDEIGAAIQDFLVNDVYK